MFGGFVILEVHVSEDLFYKTDIGFIISTMDFFFFFFSPVVMVCRCSRARNQTCATAVTQTTAVKMLDSLTC